jgi:hypothetical protein
MKNLILNKQAYTLNLNFHQHSHRHFTTSFSLNTLHSNFLLSQRNWKHSTHLYSSAHQCSEYRKAVHISVIHTENAVGPECSICPK